MFPRRPHRLFSTLAALALASFIAPLTTPAQGISLVRVWPDYRTAESFVRIAEYFGGKESAPEIIVRTQPEARAGYYFLTRFESTQPLPGSIIALEYYVPGDESARVHFLPADLPAGSRAFLAGITGTDWPDAAITPTAWRIRLLGPSGDEIARSQSFLWSLPPAPAAATASATAETTLATSSVPSLTP